MGKVVTIIMNILKVVKKVDVDLSTTAYGKIKLCFTIDPKEIV